MELQNYFKPPGGIDNPLTGGAIASGSSISPDRLVHHVTGTGVISTINLPYPGFTGPIYLIADDGFQFDTSGNIAVVGNKLAQSVTVLLYDQATSKWYPINPGSFTPPVLVITAPTTGPLGGLSSTITATATATAPATLVQAEFFWQDAEGGLHGPVYPIGIAMGGSPYSLLWTFPLCAETLGDKVQLTGKVLDSNGIYSTIRGCDVRLTGRGC
jgi:hypothetical protein